MRVSNASANGDVQAYLVHKVLAMIVTQILRPDHSMKIRFHQFLDEVHFLKAVKGGRLNDIQDRDDLQEGRMSKGFKALHRGLTHVVADLIHGEMLE